MNKSQIGQHTNNIASLADVNKDIVVLGHEEKAGYGSKQSEGKKMTVRIHKAIIPEFSERNIGGWDYSKRTITSH